MGAVPDPPAEPPWATRPCTCTRVSALRGPAHGRRIYDWARFETRPSHREDRRHWVLARRSVSRPEEDWK
ncbi:hypothetical protein BM536_036300 [Streptomyces phaeoluteigriseus]|uniref:Uncharacterized protein n=1 Tax=Streptomyces phaeoluteigriseus TaxID=114686 RepID=A0A1V6MIE1_9ACTN|nr:hypothetical protein BM536_036300 [Streptomyces phaeoluteigriseus]